LLLMRKLDGTVVTCRAHRLRFDLATGCGAGQSGLRTRSFPVRLQDSRVQIDLAPTDE
jgi:nitrite reductase/ring-hydroxylating ferredoxin subunit